MTSIRLIPILAVALTFAAICFDLSHPTQFYAVPSQMSHEMSGTVQRIDRKTLTILVAGESKATVFTWNTKETKFVRDGAFTSVDALRAGTQVIIRCSHPLFGPAPVLYQVSWQTGAHKQRKARKT
jgi:hypothetical protein